MDVLRTARELAEALLASEAFAAYQQAEIDLLNDDEAQALMAELEQAEAGLRAAAQAGGADARRALERVHELTRELEARPVYTRYRAARRQLDAFVTRVLDQVSYAISGTTRRDVPCGSNDEPDPEDLQGPAFDAARRLAAELLQTPEYAAFAEAERAFLTDAGVQAWIEELRGLEERLRGLVFASREEAEELRRRVAELKQAIASRPSHARFVAARAAFDRLVGVVLDAVHFGFTGTHRQEAGCGSSGRFCGCGSGLYLPSPRRIERVLSPTA